ncbi:MAG: TRAP transporter small permease [Gammaproteobacteria bacterium]|nr:TRAP transporter small permease [Gammaproteobacteria bacterium]
MDTNESSTAEKLRRVVRLVEDGLIVTTMSAMILLAATQILLRNLLDSGISWGDPTLRVLVLWTALLGAMGASRDGNHIRIDVLSRFLSGRYQRLSRRVTDIFAGLVCALLAWHSGRFVIYEWEDGSLLFGSVPAWACEIILPVAFAVMAIRFFLGTLPASEEPEYK